MARVTKKAVAVIAGVAAAATVLTACSATGTEGEGNPWPEVTTTAPARPAQPAPAEEVAVEHTAAEQRFLETTRANIPYLSDDDAVVLQLGRQIASAFGERGASVEDLLMVLTEAPGSNWDLDGASYFVGASVAAFGSSSDVARLQEWAEAHG